MAFGLPWPHLGQPWVPLGSPLCPTCVQLWLQVEIWSISENVCFPMCFQWFLTVGGASGAPEGRLEGRLGYTLGAKVITWTYIFAIRIQAQFLNATWERQTRRLEAIVGPAEGGEASLRALQRFFTLLFSTPCYLLAEVRRIYISNCLRPSRHRAFANR